MSTDAGVQSWNSRLLPLINGQFAEQTITFAGRTWTLDDYSYAGYFLGTKSLGSVPCNLADVMGPGDITQLVQAAVEAVGKAGGGIVRIPAGSFTSRSAGIAAHSP